MANGTEIRALELGEQIAQKQNVYIVDAHTKSRFILIRYAIILTKRRNWYRRM